MSFVDDAMKQSIDITPTLPVIIVSTPILHTAQQNPHTTSDKLQV